MIKYIEKENFFFKKPAVKRLRQLRSPHPQEFDQSDPSTGAARLEGFGEGTPSCFGKFGHSFPHFGRKSSKNSSISGENLTEILRFWEEIRLKFFDFER
jgi:hypothetical protein